MTSQLSDFTHALLAAAKRAGADAADAMAVDATSLSIDVRAGALEHAERSEGTEIGLRVLVGQRQATISASDTRPETIDTLAERAVAMARLAPEDPYAGLADANQLAQNTDMTALDLCEDADDPSPDTLQEAAAAAEASALEHDGISQVQASSAGYSRSTAHLSASNGFDGGYTRSSHGLSCVAIAGTGADMERDYDGDSRIYRTDLRNADEIGASAATRALARIDARKPPTGAFPVLFDERISSSLIGHLLAASNGSSVARGASWLRDAMGEQVLPEGLDLVEDPHRVRISGSRLFDGEGLATAPRHIIKDGILQGWTLDLATARKLGMTSTANAARGIAGSPSPSTWNVALSQGSATRDELLRDMGTGLLITSMIGSTINPNTGDYSRGAAGHWVENGEITYAVNECTVAGNLRDMLKSIVPANDARTHLTRVVPSLLVEGMTLAGS